MVKGKKVIIIASSGYPNLFSPVTAEQPDIDLLLDTYSPLEIEGRRFGNLSDLETFITQKNGWPARNSGSSAANITKTTYLNGLFLFNCLHRAGFDPVLVNDFYADRDVFVNAVEHEVLAIAISTTFLPFKEHVEDIVRTIRSMNKDVPIILGGPMVYLSHALYTDPDPHYPPEVVRKLYLFFDASRDINYYVIDRRGEKTLIKLLHAIEERRDAGSVENIGVLVGEKICFTARNPEIGDVRDEIIEWDKIPDQLLNHTIGVRGSAGCPFTCQFCNFHFYAPSVLRKPLPALMRELDQLSRRKQVKHIDFVDDNFLIGSTKLEEFCRVLVDRQYSFTWSSLIRADSVTRENIDLVADSGADLLAFGVESGSPEILTKMNKRVDRERVLKVINGMGERGISTSSTLVVGFPGETSETISQTIDFLNSYKSGAKSIHWFVPYVFMLLPKVRVEQSREKYGLQGFMLKWRHSSMDVHEACGQLRRIMTEARQVSFVYSREFLLAKDVLGISKDKAVELVRLIDAHIRNQILFKDTKDLTLLDDNALLLMKIERFFSPAEQDRG
jgi:anaerobic magnesium-protoporphyrin IX monomethyl ester cyclase